MTSITLEEYELIGDSKYRVYVSAIDKILNSFAGSNDWPDLISSLRKINKVLIANSQFPVIPRRITLSKRLAQCLHPALPSGVHLKALETYDLIFSSMGMERLSAELFIFSAGLFPLLSHSATNVQTFLLSIYENHFVPLGIYLRPALAGFLCGVLMGFEESSENFERIYNLLVKMCEGVGPEVFYVSIWECVLSDINLRLPALTFMLLQFDQNVNVNDQSYLMGRDVDMMVRALCACLRDKNNLVKRHCLDVLLVGFPLHKDLLSKEDKARLVTSAVYVVTGSDRSLSRRLFAWLMGIEKTSQKSVSSRKNVNDNTETNCDKSETDLYQIVKQESSEMYFERNSRELLVQASKTVLVSNESSNSKCDIQPYMILLSLLEHPVLGKHILEDILTTMIRSLHNTCVYILCQPWICSSQSLPKRVQDLIETSNRTFATLPPGYIWEYITNIFQQSLSRLSTSNSVNDTDEIGIVELCNLTDFLLDVIPYNYSLIVKQFTSMLTLILSMSSENCLYLNSTQLHCILRTCRQILKRIQNVGFASVLSDEDIQIVVRNFSLFFCTFVCNKVIISDGVCSIDALYKDLVLSRNSQSKKAQTSITALLTSDTIQNRTDTMHLTHIRKTNKCDFIVPPVVPVQNDVLNYEDALKELMDLMVELASADSTNNDDSDKSESDSVIKDRITNEVNPNTNVSCMSPWLQTLHILCCQLPSDVHSLQFKAISGFLELSALHKDVKSETSRPKHLFTLMHEEQWEATNKLVDVYEVLAFLLWNCMSFLPWQYTPQCSELIVHLSVLSPDDVERTIASSLCKYADPEDLRTAMVHFAQLWAHSREIDSAQKGFLPRCVLLMLDALTYPCGILRSATEDWLTHCLAQKDLARVLEPLFLILLDSSTARIGITNVQVRSSIATVNLDESDASESTKIYAISSVNGQVIYHVSLDSAQPVQVTPAQQKHFALTSLSAGSDSATETSSILNYDGPTPTHEDRLVSMFINPLVSDTEETQSNKKVARSNPDLLQGAHRFEHISRQYGSTNDINTSDNKSNDSVLASINDIETSSLKCMQLGELAKGCSPNINEDNVLPLHSHLLLYIQVFDSSRTLYALEVLDAILHSCCDFRPILFGLATSQVSSSLLPIMSRHKKSVMGKGFNGKLQQDEQSTCRNSRLLELILSVCISYCCSLYPNLGHLKLTKQEVKGNLRVQLLAVRVLDGLCRQLTGIVASNQKGFSSYIDHILQKFKVQESLLHCLLTTVIVLEDEGVVNNRNPDTKLTLTEEVVMFNYSIFDENEHEEKREYYAISLQMRLLRLLQAVIVLEDVINMRDTKSSPNTTPNYFNYAITRAKYLQYTVIPLQPMFIAAVLKTLQNDNLRMIHQHWLSIVIASLPFMGPALSVTVVAIAQQVCINLEHLAAMCVKKMDDRWCPVPCDYTWQLLEALASVCHFCLLDGSELVIQVAPMSPSPPQNNQIGANTSQVLTNLFSVFFSVAMQEPRNKDHGTSSFISVLTARKVLISKMPRIIASIAAMWQAANISESSPFAESIIGASTPLRNRLMAFLDPIAHHHTLNFLAAMAVAWQEQGKYSLQDTIIPNKNLTAEQNVLVDMLCALRVLPVDTLIQKVNQVVLQPPHVDGPVQEIPLEVSLLQLFSVYLRSCSSSSVILRTEGWASFAALLRDSSSMCPSAQCLLLAIFSDFVTSEDVNIGDLNKKMLKEIQELASKLIEGVLSIAASALEQSSWLRWNLSVKPTSVIMDLSQNNNNSKSDDSDSSDNINGTMDNNVTTPQRLLRAEDQNSVQALQVLAEILAPLLDVVYKSEEKERVIPIVSSVMHTITPFLKHHSASNSISFLACSHLLASISSYHYSRKAWKKDTFELLFELTAFQMDKESLKHWSQTVDNLMSQEKTGFKDLIARMSVASASGSLNPFSSRELEFQHQTHLLKCLAFVIFCSQKDQYCKAMSVIQERLVEVLRHPQSPPPAMLACVFLCFRVILLRVSPAHVALLWPVIVSELVNVLLQIEMQLTSTSEEFSSHVRRLAGLDSSWVVNNQNGLHAHGHPSWLHLYLAACKLLDMATLLPSHILPEFQMYRWAFIASKAGRTDPSEEVNQALPKFIPHVTRLTKLLLDKLITTPEASENLKQSLNNEQGVNAPMLTSHSLRSIDDLLPFFYILDHRPVTIQEDNPERAKSILHTIEGVLQDDFSEPFSVN